MPRSSERRCRMGRQDSSESAHFRVVTGVALGCALSAVAIFHPAPTAGGGGGRSRQDELGKHGSQPQRLGSPPTGRRTRSLVQGLKGDPTYLLWRAPETRSALQANQCESAPPGYCVDALEQRRLKQLWCVRATAAVRRTGKGYRGPRFRCRLALAQMSAVENDTDVPEAVVDTAFPPPGEKPGGLGLDPRVSPFLPPVQSAHAPPLCLHQAG